MTNDELNEYILHYLTEDKTQSAIMLTGDWGTGKSYYINNTLKPFLEKDENGNHQCIVVSLYGIKETVEISKAIYLETSARIFQTKTESGAAAKFTAKTIVKGVTSFFGVDLSASSDEMRELYESADLSGKLIVLEDLERSGLDILQVLGYVNNLVEQDGVRVLLVANESEIIQYVHFIADTKEQQDTIDLIEKYSDTENRKYTETTTKYLETKEKTVSDTIIFEGDFQKAIKQIIDQFKCENLSAISNDDGIEEIISRCRDYSITNLRTILYACQKTVDIFNTVKLDFSTDADYMKTVFFGILAFSHTLKSGEKTIWKGGDDFSVELGTKEYPLFRSCYDYIKWHSYDAGRVGIEKEALEKLRLYDKEKSNGDKDLLILYSWWLFSEKEVLEAVQRVSDRLKNEGDISFHEYGDLAYYLIAIRNILDCDIEDAKSLLISNLRNKGTEIDSDYLFTTVPRYEKNAEVVAEYETLRDAMTESLAAKDTTIFNFDYQPTGISVFHKTANEKGGIILRNGAFASRLNNEKICEMLKCCNAEQIQMFRGIFWDVYRSGNIGDFLAADKESIDQLIEKVKELTEYEGFDKIQVLQINYFIENLTEISAKLHRTAR